MTGNDHVHAPETKPLYPVVCLGASAGGLEALQLFFSELSEACGLPFIVVVHLSPDFESLMPELIGRNTFMPVNAARDGDVIEPDHVYIIPPGKNMVLRQGVLKLETQDRRPGHTLNLPIDIFLKSLAEDVGDRAIGTILSGTGSDGSRGIRCVREAGGVVLAQSPESAKFNGMPLSALQTGLVDQRGTPAELALRIVSLACSPFPRDGEEKGEASALTYESTLKLLKQDNSVDLSYLRPKMVNRRILRRMILQGVGRDEYFKRLTLDAAERAHLFGDLLIGVTSFFRDKSFFQTLKDKPIKEILLALPADETMRVWVAGCSAGCEVYSLCIMIKEAMAAAGIERNLKIFATDIDDRGLRHASRGVYSLSEVSDIPTELVSKYFHPQDNEFVVQRALRECVVFARHNLVADAPFTKMNLVTCRNLLIYLQPEAQTRAMASLISALRLSDGVLFLGSAETPAPLGSALTCLDAKAKIYRRNDLPLPPADTLLHHKPLSVVPAPAHFNSSSLEKKSRSEASFLRQVLEASFEAESQTAVVIDGNLRLVEVITDPLGLLAMPKGRPSNDLARLIDRELLAAITAGHQRLLTGQSQAVYKGSRGSGKKRQRFVVTQRPLVLDRTSVDDLRLVVLKLQDATGPEPDVKDVDPTTSQQVIELEQELHQMRESLQATIEELQSANEEQQSSNEELIASNEELQSTNEELHSVNEELYTVNSEFNRKNTELHILTGDLSSLLNSTQIATLYLDEELKVRKFTDSVSLVLPLQRGDEGRPLADLVHQLDIDIVEMTQSVLQTRVQCKREVRSRTGAWILMSVSPHESLEPERSGVLVTFVDVTVIKNAEQSALVMSRELARSNTELVSKRQELEDLISIVAHDLKRPVMGLDSKLKLASKHLKDDKPAECEGHLDKALTLLSNLRTMLKDLSDMSRLNHFEVEIEQVDLREWLDTLMERFKVKAGEKGVRLQWTSDYGNYGFARAAVDGILNNLVENALLHGTDHETPTIDVSCHTIGPNLRLSVVDNGKGIAAKYHERIFEIFRRLAPDETEGSGVGLLGARRYAERAEGQLWVESEEGSGAKFIAEVPIAKKLTQGTESKQSILLIEDDTLDAKQVRLALKGRPLHWVRNLADAKSELANGDYDIILLDLSLPDGHGLEIVTELAGIKSPPPVLVLSGHTEGLQEESLGVTHISGTFNKDEINTPSFATTVDQLVSQKGARP